MNKVNCECYNVGLGNSEGEVKVNIDGNMAMTIKDNITVKETKIII